VLSASVQEIAAVVSGGLCPADSGVRVTGVAIDSRTVEPGMLFVAFPGDRADGHDFIDEAVDKGAAAVVFARNPSVGAPSGPSGGVPGPGNGLDGSGGGVSAGLGGGRLWTIGSVPTIRVPDGKRALQQLAAWHRSRLPVTVVGVTGSTGKTTTKDMLASVLGVRFKTVATERNLNNEIGVPLTLLAAAEYTDVIVCEMGMRGAGQIAELADIARPDIGVITNVGTSHIGLLGTQEAIADAKGELARAIPLTGSVLVNGDDGYAAAVVRGAQARIISFGPGAHNDVRAEDIRLDRYGRASFSLACRGVRRDDGSGCEAEACAVTLPIAGRHNVYNALAAAAVGLQLGLTFTEIAQGLAATQVTDMRMEVLHSPKGVTVINDAYNASPHSMSVAIMALMEMEATGRRCAVLGDMAELGAHSKDAHFGIGEDLAKQGIDLLVTVGEQARHIVEGARQAGLDGLRIHMFDDPCEAGGFLGEELRSGDTVLVKASRVMGLERIAERLVTPRVE